MDRPKKEVALACRVDEATARKFRRIADSRGVAYATLLRQWVFEKIAETKLK